MMVSPKSLTLTKQQSVAVEGAATDWPSLVVAGAGSGKTELMATRVLWLVANGICRPEEILGLTFTRKAASELSRRITNALTVLSKSNLWPEGLEKDFAQPNITTYNSYANALYRDYCLALGFEDDALLLTDASRYQLAREVVMRYGEELDARILDSELSVNTIVDGVLSLAGAMTDHGVTADQVEAHIAGLVNEIGNLPASAKAKVSAEQPIYQSLLNEIEGIISTPMLARLAEGFIREKHARGMIDYSDQVALAERAVRELGALVIDRERVTYKQVLLDEFQDTSTLQTKLLAGLFKETSVFAVGDPNQSIYGWRGASASNLADFLTVFGTKDRVVEQFPLTTSWRNPKVVLDLANHILGELNHPAEFLNERPALAKVEVDPLEPSSFAGEGKVTIRFAETMDSEAKYLATWFKQNMVPDADGKLPTAALLMRTRKFMEYFADALEAEGLSVDVVGLGGLLESPEIVDLIAALRVIHYPQAGAHLLRLLAGPRWQVQPKDLQRLHRYSKKVAKFWQTGDVRVTGQEAESSLIDALDLLVDEEDRTQLPDFTEQGLAALRNCGKLLRDLRGQSGLPLTEFVKAVADELWLDIELTANPKRMEPLARLNAFYGVVGNFTQGTHPTLGSFLEWLDYANEFERFETPSVSAKNGVVQVITAHSAKGLEWDLVAVPRLIDGVFPDTRKRRGWLKAGVLPYRLRGDSNSLPELSIVGCTTQSDVLKAVQAFKDEDQREYLIREDRRIAYVAFTRPRQQLLLSGAKWAPGLKTESEASTFLKEAAMLVDPRIEVVDNTGDPANPLPNYPNSIANPLDLQSLNEVWPMEPLGSQHRPKVEAAAESVNAAKDVKRPDTTEIDRQIDLLLAEQHELEQRIYEARFPVRIPASAFKDFIYDLPKVAEKYRRPLPEQPYKQTMAGTLFHGWVEARFGVLSGSDEIDAVELPNEDDATTKTVEELRAIFEKSRFADMKPFAIETEIQVTIRGNTFICKLDAVFETEDGYEIVDWKTGKPPVTEDEIAQRALQLALYRMAFTRLHSVAPEKVGVCLYYVADDLEIKPEHVQSSEELLALWDRVLEKLVV
ncbi:MAG: hypothetical protein RLZ53_349 [Actinomycetota bacterium]